MSDIDPQNLPPQSREAQQAVRGLPRVDARAAFREQLRRDFVHGAIQRVLVAEPPPEPLITRIWRIPFVRLLIPAVGLAAIVVVALLYNAASKPYWTIDQASGTGAIWVNDNRVPAERFAAEVPRLKGGERIRLDADAQLNLVLGKKLLLQAVAQTQFELPAAPGALTTGSIHGAINGGEIRFSTGPEFAGSRLVIDGPTATAVVTGTTLAVLCSSDTTCVCVFDGSVSMTDRRGESEIVRAGTRRTVFAENRPAYAEPILPMETMKLSMLRDAARQRLGTVQGEEKEQK